MGLFNDQGRLDARVLEQIAGMVVDRMQMPWQSSPVLAGGAIGGYGQSITPETPSFRAEITAPLSAGGYGFQEVQEVAVGNTGLSTVGGGIFAPIDGGRTDEIGFFPAYEENGSTTVASGTIARLRLSIKGDHYLFAAPGSSAGGGGIGSLTIAEVDGAPSISGVTSITLDQADGFVLSGTSPNARIDIAPASLTQTGVVDLTSGQVLGAGDKTIAGSTLLVDPTLVGFSATALLRLQPSGVVSGVANVVFSASTNNGICNMAAICGYGEWTIRKWNVGVASAFELLDGASPIAYAINGQRGVTGTGGGGDTVIGGVITALGSPSLSGASGTVTLGKLTVGGTLGSLTFVNGLCTALTAPT